MSRLSETGHSMWYVIKNIFSNVQFASSIVHAELM